MPVLIWMTVIFTASGDSQSFGHSSRILRPILHWLFPHMSEDELFHVVTVFRKIAHITEYAVMAFLFWRALRKPTKDDTRPWSWKHAGLAVLFVALYAASDECHQIFVPTRYASPVDVMIDTCGGALGILLVWAWARFRGPTAGSHQYV